MSCQNRIHMLIAIPSIIIRSGLVSVLKRFKTLNIDIAEVSDLSDLASQLCRYKPDILFVDPSYIGIFSLNQIKNDCQCCTMKSIALLNTLTDKSSLQDYDEVISIFDSSDTIKQKITAIGKKENDSEILKNELSTREKEIVICVVKGMTNKQMADYLSLSAHTIMAHRRNISNKLQIHSPAGLTIYAIVNKLVDIYEVKNTIMSEEL